MLRRVLINARCLVKKQKWFCDGLLIENRRSNVIDERFWLSAQHPSRGRLNWRRLFSTESSIREGEHLYQSALEALKKAEIQNEEKEEKKSKQQYEAWQRAQQRNPVSGGYFV
jgi:hypothetical protein